MRKLIHRLSSTYRCRAAVSLTIASRELLVPGVTSEEAPGRSLGLTQPSCNPNSTGSYGTWAYVMFDGGPTYTIVIREEGNDVILISSFTDGSRSESMLVRRRNGDDCA